MSYRVLVCGGRNFNDRDLVAKTIESLERKPDTIIQGGANGADLLAKEYAAFNRIHCLTFYAQWSIHGKAAGPIRNKLMLVEGQPDLVLAFDGGRGTANMITTARKHGVEVREVLPDERAAQHGGD
jgi:hypothetical protein